MGKSLVDSLTELRAGVTLITEAVDAMAAVVDGNEPAPVVAQSARTAVLGGPVRRKSTANMSGKRITATQARQAKTLMKKLKAYRINNKLSQRAMAVKMGFAPSMVAAYGHWEKKRTNPNVPNFKRLVAFASAANL